MVELTLKSSAYTEIDETHTRVDLRFSDTDDIGEESQFVDISLIVEHQKFPRLPELQIEALHAARTLTKLKCDEIEALLDDAFR